MEGEKHFSVVVRLHEADRTLANLMELPVATPDGAQVPLSAVATFHMKTGAMNIAREDGRRVVPVGVFIAGRDLGQHRCGDAAPGGAVRHVAARVRHLVVRRVRESEARDGAARDRRAAVDPRDLRHPVQRIRVGTQRGADPGECAVCADRRDRPALSSPASRCPSRRRSDSSRCSGRPCSTAW